MFTYNAPNDDGKRAPQSGAGWRASLSSGRWSQTGSIGVTLVEIPAETPLGAQLDQHSLPVRAPSDRSARPSPASHRTHQDPAARGRISRNLFSDRRCTVGGQLYEARLIDFDGIAQGIAGESDDASFTFGNADR